MKFIKYLPILLCFFLLVSCEQEEQTPGGQGISFYLSRESNTRANEIHSFANGDAVGVFVLNKSENNTLQAAGNFADNRKYIWNEEKKAFIAATLEEMIYNYPDLPLEFYVYFPYYSSITDATNLAHAVSGNKREDDFLYAVNSDTSGAKDIDLSFTHLLSKVNVKYTSTENRDKTSMSVYTYTDTKINLANGKVITLTDSRKDIVLERVNETDYAGFVGVVPPQTWAQGEKFGTLTYTGIGSYPFSFPKSRTFASGEENEVFFMSREPAYVFSVSPTTLTAAAKPTGPYSITITSTKSTAINGDNLPGTTVDQGYSVTSKPDWVTVSGSSVTVAENRTSSVRSGSINFKQDESGLTASVAITQSAGVTTYDYTFTFSDGTTSKSWSSVSSNGGSSSYSITSTRKILINGTVDSTESVTYSASSNVSWITISGTNLTVAENRSSARSGVVTFTQADSKKTITVNVSQSAGETTYEYTFTFEDGATSKSWSGVNPTGGTNSYPITSTRKVLINGTFEKNESVGFSGSANVAWITISGISVIVSDNPNSTPRGGIATFTQTGSGKTITVTILQQKKNSVEID